MGARAGALSSRIAKRRVHRFIPLAALLLAAAGGLRQSGLR